MFADFCLLRIAVPVLEKLYIDLESYIASYACTVSTFQYEYYQVALGKLIKIVV